MRLSDLADEVRRRAAYCCEYCRVPQIAFRPPLHIEHIVARQHGGLTEPDNLALACRNCNLKEGPNLTGIDPASGHVVRLFRPRRDLWAAHFATERASIGNSIEIHGLTPVGRATVRVLRMNEEPWPSLRYELWRESNF